MVQQRTKSQVRQGRKRVRRRLRKGRVTMALSVLALIVVGIVWLVARCSDSDAIRHPELHDPVPEAVAAGREDARKVFETAPGSMERQNALLYIKSRETDIRRAGYPHAAADYLHAAQQELQSLKY